MTSPISIFLREFRLREGLTQLDLAYQIGCEQGYVSAMERGLKNPSSEYLERFVSDLGMHPADKENLLIAARQSKRHFSLSGDASASTYVFCADLWERIERLHPAVLQAMHSLIRIDEVIVNRPQEQPSRIRRRTKLEAPM